MICTYCGISSTGTHWPSCPHYTGAYPEPAIVRRTDKERMAFISGYETALKMVEAHGVETAHASLDLLKETNA